jgi:hypothetical protein
MTSKHWTRWLAAENRCVVQILPLHATSIPPSLYLSLGGT